MSWRTAFSCAMGIATLLACMSMIQHGKTRKPAYDSSESWESRCRVKGGVAVHVREPRWESLCIDKKALISP